MQDLGKLTDSSLVEETLQAVSNERSALIILLKSLNEIERRELHLKMGYSSMFAFATKRLRYSEFQAFQRIKAARCTRDYPEAEELLRIGKLNLCTITLAAKELTRDNQTEVLKRLSGVSKKKAEELLAKDRPAKKVVDKIKVVGKRIAPEYEASLPIFSQKVTLPGQSSETSNLDTESTGLSFEVKFSSGEEFQGKLKEVQSLLSGKFPGGASLEEVFGECLEAYLDKKCPKRRAAKREKREAKTPKPGTRNQKPGCTNPTKQSRVIPAQVRDIVVARDKSKCTYTAPDGTRCCSRHNLEIDHIIPFAIGGTNEPNNLRLLCRKHNRLEAKRVFGEGMIEACMQTS